MTTIFSSERITFAAFSNDDLPQFAGWLSDFGLQRLVNPGMSVPHDVDDLLDPDGWFQADLRNEHSRLFALRTTEGDVFIGVVALSTMDPVAHCAEVGINLAHPDYRGKGFGREAMRLLMRYGFEQCNLNRLYLTVMDYNRPAIRLYEMLGFVHEAREREALFHDERYFDLLHMGLLRSEWEALHG